MGRHTRKYILVRLPIRVSLVQILYSHSKSECFHFIAKIGVNDEKAEEMHYLN